MELEFIPLYFGKYLRIVNPRGTIGIVTLWSHVDYILRQLERAHIDLSSETSPIAVVGTLYGNGLREMLRNLLYNPQIDTLLLFGRNRSGSQEELINFFSKGLEPYPVQYCTYKATADGKKPMTMRIKGTSRIIDSLVQPKHFQHPPSVIPMGNPKEPGALERLRGFIYSYKPRSGPIPKRLEIPLPEVSISCFPSNPRAHTIISDDPLSAWMELIFLLHRFGQPVKLAKGDRLELQNIKVIVEHPHESQVPPEELRSYGFDIKQLDIYQREILNPERQPDESYTYGNRLRHYFGLDSLTVAIERLRSDPEDRKSYVVLWDPRRDLTAAEGHPCLVSLFFRRFQGKLTLTATFRTHNALDAWLVNLYGLMAIHRFVASGCDMPPGAITVFSHSISVDTKQLDRVAIIAAKGRLKRGYKQDPMGYFKISITDGEIVAQHCFGDIVIKEYRHTKATRLQQEIYRDGGISDINHALYVGRQLARAEICLKTGKPFIQE